MFQEDVLYIPWVLAILGDNPMQSELVCHVGLAGNLFCRVCHVSKVPCTPGLAGEKDRIVRFMQVRALR